MRRIGLTGGIASGKSAVSAMFRELGAEVIDADALAREVVAPGTEGLAAVGRRFPGVVGADGRLDRARLGARVFADPAERAALEALLHPLIRAAFHRRAEALAERGVEVVLYDAALLVEKELHRELDGLIVVSAPPEVQRARLMKRDGLTAQEADARIAAQLPLAEKLTHATWVIDNGGELEDTRRQVRSVWRTLRGGGSHMLPPP